MQVGEIEVFVEAVGDDAVVTESQRLQLFTKRKVLGQLGRRMIDQVQVRWFR